jgi:hypothetical protein
VGELFMNLKKIKIGLLVMLFMGICVLPATAVKLLDVNYLLNPVGEMNDSAESGDFYVQTYDILYLDLESNGRILIQIRGEGGDQLEEWSGMENTIALSHVVQNGGPVYIYIENLENNQTLVTGTLALNVYEETTTTTPNNGGGSGGDGGIFIGFLYVIYAIAGVLFITSVVVYRRRKNPTFKFLYHIEDEELLPEGWQPEEEEI